MKCETCHGRGHVPILDDAGVQIGLAPCAACGGSSTAHCCDGLTACNDPEHTTERGGGAR